MAGSGMEVDPPTTSSVSLGLGTLKRSNSAPMINVLGTSTQCSPTISGSCCSSTSGESPATLMSSANSSSTTSSGVAHSFQPAEVHRMRRFSASCAQGLHSPTGIKTPNRLDQIKHEESIAIKEREAAHEQKVQQTMQISQSWEDMRLDEPMLTDNKRPKSFGEPLHISTFTYPYSCSPSPTRATTGKQCFSPSLKAPVKNSSLTPSPSPSPTRKSFRRSASPIATGQLRPSRLGLKRKVELEDCERLDTYFSPPKRLQSGLTTPEKQHVVHPIIHCMSASNQNNNESTQDQVPNVPTVVSTSLSTMSTSEPSYLTQATTSPTYSSLTTTSPASCFTFRPVRDCIDAHATDSETSDMVETADGGETVNRLCYLDQSPPTSFNSSSKIQDQRPQV